MIQLDRVNSIDRTNRVGIVLVSIITIVNIIVGYFFQNRGFIPGDGTIRLMLLDLMLVISWSLYHFNKKRLSTLITETSIYIAFFLYPLLPFVNSRPAEDLFILIFLYAVISPLNYVLHDIRKEYKFVISWQLLLLITFLVAMYASINVLEVPRYRALKMTFLNQPLLTVGYLIAISFLHVIIIQFKKKNREYQVELNAKNKELRNRIRDIHHQKLQLEHQKQQLSESRDRLNKIHGRLEVEVNERTQRLKTLNRKIIEFGFRNSTNFTESIDQLHHLLKDPEAMSSEWYDRLDVTVEKMDDEIRAIGHNLEISTDKMEL
jgi:uncharacterized protein YoxC